MPTKTNHFTVFLTIVYPYVYFSLKHLYQVIKSHVINSIYYELWVFCGRSAELCRGHYSFSNESKQCLQNRTRVIWSNKQIENSPIS